MTPKQDTINRWCNVEALNEYACRLRHWAQNEREAGRDAIAGDLDRASDDLCTAAAAVAMATHRATMAAYDRLDHHDH